MQIRTHLREVEVRVEDIAGHVMRIGARESDTIESFYLVYMIE